jgi:hypothetical protein
MTVLKCLSIIFVSVLLIACTQEDNQDQTEHADEKQAALRSAEKWLEIVDEGKYGESWDEAASIFRKVLSQELWLQKVTAVRPGYGKVLERNLQTQNYRTVVPGAPEGEYVIIQFQTTFENKASTVETITPYKEKDGTWRVSGYFIK